jgi:outer membrane protein assembly factor BamE (lipoprotein component of BamABCDE complex)
MIELSAVESRLALFAEGIAGRFLHIKPNTEFSSRRMSLSADQAALTSDTLLLPESIAADNPAFYRVLAMEQLAQREFGTLEFKLSVARERIPELAGNRAKANALRMSDFEMFYQSVSQPQLLQRCFFACERARLNARLRCHYPGIRRHQDAYHKHLLQSLDWSDDPRSPGALLTTLRAYVLGAQRGRTPMAERLSRILDDMTKPGSDVYAAARAGMNCYKLCEPMLHSEASIELMEPDASELDDPTHWLQREARLEDWRAELKAMDTAMLQVEMLQGDEAVAQSVEQLTDGEIRPDDIDLRALKNERDTAARRLDMERSAVQDALGKPQLNARSYRYDEWDYLRQSYLAKWCRLYEEQLEPTDDRDLGPLLRVIDTHRSQVQQQLENIKPLGFQRIFRVADGDELDFNAIVQARQDIRAGKTPDERVYSRRDRVHRDVCAGFLVDLSASTDDTIEPSEGPGNETTPESELKPNLRDPFDDPDPVAALTAEEPGRRIIDVQRESMLVMSSALEQLGDSYGIYGFSGYGKDCVEFFVAKEVEQPFTRKTLRAIAEMKPKRSTRMGPAIRHCVSKLVKSGHALKVLIILSDGFPQDSDYGPERGDHEYGVQDTAKALHEAQEKGVETFCVTVDRSGHDYLQRMCPDERYLVIDEVEDLPEALSKVYQALTS